MVKTKFNHIGITCKDPVKTEEFYVKYFGFERSNSFREGKRQIVLIKKDKMFLELFYSKEKLPIDKPERDGYPFPGLRHISFLVEDMEKFLDVLGEDKNISMGPLNLDEFYPGMKAIWLKDPEGNIVELNEIPRNK